MILNNHYTQCATYNFSKAPTLAASNTWYKGTAARNTYTEIHIVDSYTPIGNEETWNADVDNSGSIKCYANGTVLTIVGVPFLVFQCASLENSSSLIITRYSKTSHHPIADEAWLTEQEHRYMLRSPTTVFYLIVQYSTPKLTGLKICKYNEQQLSLWR